MKKQYFLLLIGFVFVTHMWGQTTETFETETLGSTSFTDNGKVFNITSQVMGPFDIYSGSSAYGWNGTSADFRFIDNSGPGASAFNTPVQFTIAAAGGTAFNLKSMYLFLAKSDITLNVAGSVTITGRLAGATVFTASASAPFNTSLSVNNGFTFINMSTYGGQNNSNATIDEFVIATSGNIAYVALDAMTWQCPSVTLTQAAKTNVSCNGGNNGTATVSASGGNGFTYDWTPGNPPGDGTATATGLTAGNWTVTVTNSCGISNQTTFTITQPATSLSATQSQTNVACNGGTNGSASVVASGGTAPYTYSWSPSGGTNATATGLAAGNYTVTIIDANGCTIQKSFTITAPSALMATQSQNDVSCNGGSNGTATVVASGGAGSYTYLWSPSGGTGATATGLAAGNYTVTITDSNNCSIQKSFTITAPSALAATQSQNDVSCNGGSNGTATVVASGGAGSYTYLWSPSGGTNATATGLAAGNYTVTITDSNNCSIQKSFTITAPSALTATQSQTNISCNGGSNGTAAVVASGGAGSYTYLWSPSGGTGATATGLAAGNYIVTITDANGCTIQKSFTITAPSALTATQSQNDVSCNGGSNGTATVVASGGAGSYTYLWSPSGGTGATATGLAAGNYTVTITDSNNCSIQKSFTITAPSALAATQSQNDVSCNGGSNGTATVVASGGAGSYTYLWSPSGGTNATATGLAAGNYTVTITDANGCTIQKSFTITAPSALAATQSQNDVSCNGGSNGTATVVASGGAGSYTYLWSPSGGTNATATELAAGNYTVTITDANGCTIQKNFTISDCVATTPPALTAEFCGATIPEYNTPILANDVATSEGYRFRVTYNGGTEVVERTNKIFKLNMLSSYGYNTTYSVEVAVKINGVWEPYGPACDIFTDDAPTTKLRDEYCGITVAELGDSLYADTIELAEAYRFRISDGISIQVVERQNNMVRINMFSGYTYGTIYSVEVAIMIDGVWQSYGDACDVATPFAPTTTLTDEFCGTTVATFGTNIYAYGVQLAQGYRFRVSDGVTTNVIERPVRSFRIRLIPGFQYSTTYSVEVAILIDGVWGPYGPACEVTSPSSGASGFRMNMEYTSSEESIGEETVRELTAYPNPFESAFTISFKTESDEPVRIIAFDITGKVLEDRTLSVQELATARIGEHFEAGVYNIVATQGSFSKSCKMVKK